MRFKGRYWYLWNPPIDFEIDFRCHIWRLHIGLSFSLFDWMIGYCPGFTWWIGPGTLNCYWRPARGDTSGWFDPSLSFDFETWPGRFRGSHRWSFRFHPFWNWGRGSDEDHTHDICGLWSTSRVVGPYWYYESWCDDRPASASRRRHLFSWLWGSWKTSEIRWGKYYPR